MEELISQSTIQEIFIPLIRKAGRVYVKFREIIAKVAKGGEQVISVTSAGEETTNTAEMGDYIVQNQTSAREWYIVSKSKFQDRYEWVSDLDEDLARYKPKGKVMAIALSKELLSDLNYPSTFHFEAPWGEAQVAHQGDLMVTPPDYSEVYRIGKKEFAETYNLEDKDRNP
jgi:hypothetical protein